MKNRFELRLLKVGGIINLLIEIGIVTCNVAMLQNIAKVI